MEQQRHLHEERRYITKLLRCFILRAIQVVLQSRSGRLFRYACRDHSSVELLGLSFEDDPEIALSAKTKLGGLPDLRHGDTHSVQVFLTCPNAQARTDEDADNDRLYLEVWTFRFAEESDPSLRRAKAFDRLTVALKALWSVARALPAYRVARRGTTESRVLCFRLLPGAADPAVLGPGYQNRRLASVRTLAGTLSLTCSFRSPIKLGPESLRLHEGHYQLTEDSVSNNVDQTPDSVGIDSNFLQQPMSLPQPETSPVENPKPTQPPMSASASQQKQKQRQSAFCPVGPFAMVGANGFAAPFDRLSDCNGGGVGIFGDFDDDLPFQSLMSSSSTDGAATASASATAAPNDIDCGLNGGEDADSQQCEMSAELSDSPDEDDDDVLRVADGNNFQDGDGGASFARVSPLDESSVEASGDFGSAAGGGGRNGSLGSAEDIATGAAAASSISEFLPFASDCSAADLQRLQQLKSAVKLEMFAAPNPLADRIGDIPRQLKFFEQDLAEFDCMLNTMLERSSDSEPEQL
ncbi:hypothetical protein BOX15_Mlig031084g1 [Macrostomum lignano]|uniref:Autophagy-related protein 13 n=1 Tax=Macrostomum lignano TaxID=282301 RepID=A0A267GAN6_9PLAT|nr:hypothetical protein BOX15_Mlig031084g1 [Macrostomum lignano]